MNDTQSSDPLETKHERNRQQRLEAVVRWAEYISEQPADVWGPQQNAVVNAQLESAQAADRGVEHERRVRDVAEALVDVPADAERDETGR